MYTKSTCSFFKLKLYFAKVLDLADLTYLAANHIRWDTYVVTYVEN